ncbi:glycosyltransferase 61 family protein, partial [Trichodesmium erythraeum 21-75]|nr:glycosyltransferase 61 family protein [Trichodesmium erythraeum 21-75]
APHGAGLTNIVFCNPGTKVVELFSSHVKPYYWSLCNCCNLEYYSYHDPSYNFSTKDEMSLVDLAKSCQQRNQKDIFIDISLLAELLSMANLL